MEVPWWPIVSILFILWNDANICSKAEASILPQFTKPRQNIGSESEQIASKSVINFGANNGVTRPTNSQQLISQQGVFQPTFPSDNAQDQLRPQFTSTITQKQSAVVQENVSQQQKQPAVSSTSATAIQQSSLASNVPKQSTRLVFPTVVTTNHPPVQENIVQQKSLETSSSTATQSENHLVQNNILQQQSKVSSTINTDQNLMSSRSALDNSELVTPSISNRVLYQKSVPQKKISSTSTTNVFNSKNPGLFVQPVTFVNPDLLAIYQVPPQNQLKLESSILAISSANSQGEASSSSSIKQSNSINSQNRPYSPQFAPLQKVSQQSNAVLSSSSQNLQTSVAAEIIPSTINPNWISSSATQPVIRGNTLHQPTLVTSKATSETTTQRVPNTKSLDFTLPIAYGPTCNQAPSNRIYGSQGCFGFPITSINANPTLFSQAALLPGSSSCNYAVPLLQEQQVSNPVVSNGILTPLISPNTVVSNNVELTSNIRTTSPEISAISDLQSRSVSGSFPSSNFFNSNIASTHSVSSAINSVETDVVSTYNAAPLVTSNLRSPVTEFTPCFSNDVPAWLGKVPNNAYSYPNIVNPYSGNSQFPVISKPAMLTSFPGIQPVWFSNVNPSLTNLPVTNYNINCVDEPETIYVLPNQQTSLNTVSQIQQSTAVNNIASEGKNLNGVSLSSESEILQTSIQSDVSLPIEPINTIQSSPQIKEFEVPKTSLDQVEKVVNVQSSVRATQDISSGPLITEPSTSVSGIISTTKETIAESLDGGVSTASVNSYINNSPAGLTSPTITFVAPVPTILTSVTPVCSLTPSPSVSPSFSYPPIQPIIMEDSNSRTKNLLPVILASFIRDNGFSGYSGGNCNGLCNCGTQYRQGSCQTSINNNLNSCCSTRGRTSNCACRGQSNSVIIIEVESDEDNTESADTSDKEKDDSSNPTAPKDTSGGEEERIS